MGYTVNPGGMLTSRPLAEAVNGEAAAVDRLQPPVSKADVRTLALEFGMPSII